VLVPVSLVTPENRPPGGRPCHE